MTLNNRRSVVVLPIFTPNTLLERACLELNENVLVFENETRNGEMAGVQSWPKCWLSGSCPGSAMSKLVDVEHLSFRRFMSDIRN